MWNSAGSIANFKNNLNKIALDVHHFDDVDDDLTLCVGDSDRIRSHSFAHSQIHSNSTLPNGNVDSPYLSEIEHYKSEIKKLRESEAEIKALSFNYAALLKEKEDHIAKLDQENVSLKQALKNEPSKISPNSPNLVKGSQEQALNRQNKLVTSVKNRSSGNQRQNGIALKQDGQCNGFSHGIQVDPSPSYTKSIGNEKELADLLEEKNRLLVTMQADHELQMNQLHLELEKERKTFANTKRKLQDEARVSGSLTEELNTLRSDSNKTSVELTNVRKEVDDKVSEIKHLQAEMSRMKSEGVNGTESLRIVITKLEKENVELKMEKEKLEFALKDISAENKHPGSLDKSSQSSVSFPGKDELEQSLQKTEKDLKETRQDRDKALKELARLKQHLLDKELEESEKMDEDSKIIEDLQQQVDYQKATILNLERALQQTHVSQEEVRMMNDHELVKSKEIIEDLKNKVTSYMSIIDAKNTELLNLQTALGQYYAEVEAKERLEGELSLSREEYAKISQLLQDSNQQLETFTKEKEEILAKVAQSEKTTSDWRNRVIKLEEDNIKLRRALEQSMSRMNRMSMDSDFLVDRRIIIKLLVTYFQRNHSKEVLDLMVRMLGFSEEDKQRIGGAQQGAGKGVVRGVLGFPGRLVGGIIGGGGSPGTPTHAASENQSFSDLWVDFLLKESEEREKRESSEATGNVDNSPSMPVPTSPPSERRAGGSGRPPIFSSTNPSIDASRMLYSYDNTRQYDNTGSEFSIVPLTPANSFT